MTSDEIVDAIMTHIDEAVDMDVFPNPADAIAVLEEVIADINTRIAGMRDDIKRRGNR